MKVLVTGGTGVLGREVVRLVEPAAEVRVLSRSAGDRAGFVRGDLSTGEGVAEAVRGVDVIAHCASAADYRRPQRDVEQARVLLEATREGRPHVVYISIVGIDRVPFGYYRAKLAVEELLAGSGLPWTVLRTTQFHDLALLFLMLATKPPIAVLPRGIRGQPVDVGEVAERLAELVLAGPAGRVPDLGGPRVEEGEEMLRTFLTLTRRRRPVVKVPVPGRVAAAFRAGGHLLTDGMKGRRTFEEYLRDRVRPDGSFDPPYELKLRR